MAQNGMKVGGPVTAEKADHRSIVVAKVLNAFSGSLISD